jgi:hypothetical protein
VITGTIFYNLILIYSFLFININLIAYFLKSNIFKNISIILFLFYSVIFGFRDKYVGLDTLNYYNFALGNNREYSVFLNMIKYISFGDPTLFLFIINLTICTLIVFIGKELKVNIYLYLSLIASSFFFYNFNINIIRQALCIAICTYVYLVLKKTFYLRSILLFLSVFIHNTGFIFFLASLVKIKLTQIRIIVLICLYLMLYAINPTNYILNIITQFDSNKIIWEAFWQNRSEWELKHFYYLVVLMLLFIKFYKIQPKYKENLNKTITIIVIFLLLSIPFRFEEMVVDRLFYYTFLLIPFFLINIILRLKKDFVSYVTILLLINCWFYKSMIIQYPNWFINMSSIRFTK